ncbi:MAG: M20/M25/M40 family metallo-hydrolase [Kiritimatiellae bacterium]|nr:M20/M25/M40 family metallo-hydrolase [Kiritimatiellia bacterium]
MLEDIRREYFELLRFESVGADPAKLKECVSCALWLKKWLEAIGFEGELLMNEIKNGKAEPPVLYAEKIGSEGAPTVLIYGHYDVQPSDPLSEWLTPPFEPTEKDGRIYCRGSQDDKGQFFAFLNGIKDYLATNPSIVPTIKIILEGQEESGSEALIAMAESMRKRIAADVLLVCDTSAASDLRPAIVAGLRGVSHFTICLKGPSRDLHSGSYGGIAPNPAQAIAELVASLHNPDGSIAVEGFYNGIERPTSEEIAAAEAGGDTQETYEADIGCEAVGGEEGKSIIERNSFEPTIEVNGIHSGYSGPGSKTVIPSEAFAKISMRLVPGQSTRAVRDAVTKHLKAHCPRGMTLLIEDYTLGAGGFRLPLASPLFRLASDVLSEMDNRGAVYQWDGASIPVISVLKEISGAAPLIVGWGQAEDKIHSPNESYSLAQFQKAREWGRKIIAAF